MRVVATDGDAVLVADGDVGAALRPGVRPLVLPVASLLAHGDWEPADEPVPAYAPTDLADQIAAFKAQWSH